MQAASTGNAGLVEYSLMAGASVSMVANDESTALHCAAKTGQIDMMRYLLGVGAKADTTNTKGRTPLLEAVQHRDHQAFILLLQNGALFSESVLEDIIRHGQVDLLRAAFTHSSERFLRFCDPYLFNAAVKYDQPSILDMLLSVSHYDRAWLKQSGGKIIYRVIS
jgi:ankyrin repeat protein